MDDAHAVEGQAQPPAQFSPKFDTKAQRRPACPVCGGRLIEIRGKFQCSACHAICETCCEGGAGGTNHR